MTHRCRIIVSLDNNRPIVTLDVNRSGRRMVVLVIPSMFVVAIGVSMFAASIFPAIRDGYAGADKDHKSCDRKYFYNFGFHSVLQFQLRIEFTQIRGDRGGEGLHRALGRAGNREAQDS
jgi:hypothetical protein